MSNAPEKNETATGGADSNETNEPQLERGTYEIIQNRLRTHAEELRERLELLNEQRRTVFGSIETELISTERITTGNNCTPRDIIAIGNRFLFGYNVHMGLKSVTEIEDVFSVYRFEDGHFHEEPLAFLTEGDNKDFVAEFHQLYKYYTKSEFAKFHVIGPHAYFVFRTGKQATDIKSFKFLIQENGLKFIDNRSDHEVVYPEQHDFRWVRTHRDLHRGGLHPHISIEDKVFVETVGGDLTIKVEDNTEDGSGIYSEPVDDPDQTLDDAEIFYSRVGNIILLKVKPFREDAFRYLVFNEKTQAAMRLDAIADACVALPEDHGLIFSKGYYLQTGEFKTFENDITDLLFEQRIAAPNGEDYLYVFYNRQSGDYVLLSYNMIQQQVQTPIICNGFSIFENGQLIYFKSDGSAQKHHAIQIWQTPYVGQDFTLGTQDDSFIFKIGNKEIVRAMAESHEVMNLIGQDDSYANLYVDLVKKSTDILDSYFWLTDPQTFEIAEPMGLIRDSASAAVEEFDKVVRIRRNTAEQFKEASKTARDNITAAATKQFQHIDEFVKALASLRVSRGQVISLKELKYVDLEAVDELEAKIAENSERISVRCVEFLLQENSLDPYVERVANQRVEIEQLQTGMQAKQLDEQIVEGANDLEMLIDIVSNLKIDDPNQRTQIIDNISAIFSNLNQTRAALKQKSQELMSVEGAAEFNSQLKLLSQAVVNYLDVCDSPEKCDEYLTKMMVQIEEIEGRFAEFDEFIVQLAEKREEVYAAFDTKKLQLVESRNRRATSIMSAADRILKGIKSRVSGFESVDEINSYFASDLMIEKIRDLIDKLKELDESVKVDDVQSRLKTIREDTVRQLRDKNELFVDGQNIIQFGKHNFSVNVQPLDLTSVVKDGDMYFHLSGTNFFERVTNEQLYNTRDVWNQQVVSEDANVYRGEYLAYRLLEDAASGASVSAAEIVQLEDEPFLAAVQEYMAPRYSEGYIKGVHDHDAALILRQLLELDAGLDLLKYSTKARALASIYWFWLSHARSEEHAQWAAKLSSIGAARKLFGDIEDRRKYVQQFAADVKELAESAKIGDPQVADSAANYLFDQLSSNAKPVCSHHANQLCNSFLEFLTKNRAAEDFTASTHAESLTPTDRFQVVRDWMSSFVSQHAPDESEFIDEATTMLVDGTHGNRHVIDIESVRSIDGLLGDHGRINGKKYELDYNEFMTRLEFFETVTAPAFNDYIHLKKQLVDDRRESLRLEEFKPRVLTSFVRNKLINDTYLPMVGQNLAKQIGVVGEDKRTDLMGLLLLISPPGYGKTTLMEYIANRLGITFMKINGPAIGHQVTSLDPAEAPNASAREEVQKLNLALEMGDNVMIYLDDIQHCNPEFLQKFISLCDATRRIEGVFNGQSRTYDLRGRKVAVVMAGNPYTESGEKFQIPDMLASRADTYNLGDVIGDSQEPFELSYLENCLTSNPTLARLNSRSREDIFSIIKMARSSGAESETLKGNYSIEEVNEFVSVMKKLIAVRDVVLQVNMQYIESAAQADEYRTEPSFKLQGSYRDMNKIAEQIAPVMNDEELQTLIRSHYENQAQTLTTGAQANLLKLQEIMGTLAGEDLQRWDDIKRTFKRNLLLGSAGEDNQIAQVIAQMSTFSEGLADIRAAMATGVQQLVAANEASSERDSIQSVTMRELDDAKLQLSQFNENLKEIQDAIENGAIASKQTPADIPDQKIQVINKIPDTFLEVMRNQFRVLQTWMEPILELAKENQAAAGLAQAARATEAHYEKTIDQVIVKTKPVQSADAPQQSTPKKKKTGRKRKKKS